MKLTKYAKALPERTPDGYVIRESWDETVSRTEAMMMKRFPQWTDDIKEAYDAVRAGDILPSMRCLQFGGEAIEKHENRIYNCCFVAITTMKDIRDVFFNGLCGTGVGYSVQKHHVAQLPFGNFRTEGIDGHRRHTFWVEDSIEGWADALYHLLECWADGEFEPIFDFSLVRPKGSLLRSTGGCAPGPEPLAEALEQVANILRKANLRKLRTLEVHDIICHTANAVFAGGVRRSALISLFSPDDDEMLTSKMTPDWYQNERQRERANNSAVIHVDEDGPDVFWKVWSHVIASPSGCPGVFFTHDRELGTNPCFSGDMRLLTEEGLVEFARLASSPKIPRILNENGQFVSGKVWKSGTKETVILHMSNGQKLQCTPTHLLKTNDGGEVKASESLKLQLSIGLKSLNASTFKEEVALGFLLGDGCLARLASETHKGLEVCLGAKDSELRSLFGVSAEAPGKCFYLEPEWKELCLRRGMPATRTFERHLPACWAEYSSEQKRMFLRGLYSANGSVIRTERVALKTTSLRLAGEVIEALRLLGIVAYKTTNLSKKVKFKNGTYQCKESYDVCIAQAESLGRFARDIGFVHSAKQEALEKVLLKRAPRVVRIEKGPVVEVFDFALEGDNHWGIVEGFVVHNCTEAALVNGGFCNLEVISARGIRNLNELLRRARLAARIGTLQASFTNFSYLQPKWKEAAERDALLGLSITGIGMGTLDRLPLRTAAEAVLAENSLWAHRIGINPAARTTLIKPEGSTSLTLGVPFGISGWYDKWFKRRVTLFHDEPGYKYLKEVAPQLLEEDSFNPKKAYFVIPVNAANEVGFHRTSESAFDMMNRIERYYRDWILPGHRSGANTHTVSCTVNVKPHEWGKAGQWLYDRRKVVRALSVYPEFNAVHKHPPYESISEEECLKMCKDLPETLDFRLMKELSPPTWGQEAACGGGFCETL